MERISAEGSHIDNNEPSPRDSELQQILSIWQQSQAQDPEQNFFPVLSEGLEALDFIKKRQNLDEGVFQIIRRSPALRCRLFTTDTGTLGLGPLRIQPHDNLYAVPGSQAALILRPTDDDTGYCTFIGEAYIHGVGGNIMEQGFEFKEITIV